ncbi:MAG: transposase, partial [Deltaproteobacteria bacterium]
HVLGDKGYDSGALVAHIEATGAKAVIPNKKNAVTLRDTDFTLYRERNLIERFFNRLKHYRAIATRYAKRARNDLALVSITATIIWIK